MPCATVILLLTKTSEDTAIEKPIGEVKGADEPAKASQGPLRLATFDWEDFVKDGFFVSLVGGAIVSGIVLTSQASLPSWMVHSTLLLFLSLALAFTRLWKTTREERETSALWGQFGEEVSTRGSGMGEVKDAVFEIPYMFSMAFLPVSVVSLQTFAACLLIFYVADNYYNITLVHGIAADHETRPPTGPRPIVALRRRASRAAVRKLGRVTVSRIEPALMLLGAALETVFRIPDPRSKSIDRAVLTQFFRRRAMLNRVAI